MKLESVRALKQEVVQTVVSAANRQTLRLLAVPASSQRSAMQTRPGVALGVARGDGPDDYRLAVRLQSRSMLADRTLRARLTDAARGEIDLRYIGRVGKLAGDWPTTRVRPLLIGASVGHAAVTAGTIGAFPLHRQSGARVLLSNNHVLANEGRGRVGDAVLQPGVADGGSASDRIGTLLDFAPLVLTGANRVDVAIAGVDDAAAVDWRTLTGFGVQRGPVAQAPLGGESVVKLGRTTGLTRGRVSAAEVDGVVVTYETGALSFDGQIEIEGLGDDPFSLGGDSGALVVDDQGRAVGLVFSGTDQGGTNGMGLTYANEIGAVLAALDLTLDI